MYIVNQKWVLLRLCSCLENEELCATLWGLGGTLFRPGSVGRVSCAVWRGGWLLSRSCLCAGLPPPWCSGWRRQAFPGCLGLRPSVCWDCRLLSTQPGEQTGNPESLLLCCLSGLAARSPRACPFQHWLVFRPSYMWSLTCNVWGF